MTEPPQKLSAATIFIMVTVVIDALAIGIIVPVLPPLVVQLAGGNEERGAIIYGLFGTTFALMQFIFSPMIGAVSDRFGRRPVILLSNFGLGLDYILMALAPSLGWLFVGRVIAGITGASMSAAGAYIADVTPLSKRAAGFGMLGAAFGLGFILGPAIGGLLGQIGGPRLPFWIAAAGTLLNATYGLFILPESLAREHRRAFSWKRANPVGALGLLRAHRELLGLAGVTWLFYLAHESLPSAFVLYAGYRFGWEKGTVGLTLAWAGICSMVIQGTLVQPVVRRFGERRAVLAGLTFGMLGFVIYGLAPTGLLFALGIPVMALWGFYGAASQGLMTRRVSVSEQGQLQGSLTGLRGIAGLIGPGLFTGTYAAAIGPLANWNLPGAPFLLASALLGLGLVIAWQVTQGPVPRHDTRVDSDPDPDPQAELVES
ncbi:MAG: TCR/Tet family MFS transporter [Planctomycetaceae bacterium]|nr:TCR/Tet family MFS transporter [Planctomycetaceae bacterium]